jgi:hypothetical protein
MLIDEHRADSFLSAILKTVKPGDNVFDLGFGYRRMFEIDWYYRI